MGRKPTGRWKSRISYKGLSKDQTHFNNVAMRKKGRAGSKEFKRYVFGHQTNVRKGRKGH